MIRLFVSVLVLEWLCGTFSVSCAADLPFQAQTRSIGVPIVGRDGFASLLPRATGILFSNILSDSKSLTNQIFLNGSGVAAGDVDGDGRTDLYFCGLDTANALYRNQGGFWFTNVSSGMAIECRDQASTGAAFADIDGDGDLDLLVNGVARGTRLFMNDGRGGFSEATKMAGLDGKRGSTSLCMADIDGDGLLDLYVVNYRNDTMRDMPDIRFRMGVTNGVSQLISVNGRAATAPDLAGRFNFDQASGVLENGEADILYRNLGNGVFSNVPWAGGAFLDDSGNPAAIPHDWGLSAMFRDLNGDGAPDLYVCNDFQSPDRIWMNIGRGRFRAAGRDTIRQTSLFSMGVDVADVDRDGYPDIFVADMLARRHADRQVQVLESGAFAQVRNHQGPRPQTSRNTLFRCRGDGSFAEIARLAGVDASDWSWCPAFIDVDLDGYEDLLVTTGHWRDAQNADVTSRVDAESRKHPGSPREQLEARRLFPRLETPNVAFRNRGNLAFEEVGNSWGFDSRSVSHGMAFADLDDDGDLDVVVTCLNAPPLILRNDSVRPRLSVRLRGLPPNTRGVGARIRVHMPGLPVQSQEMGCGGRYLSSDDFIRVFAAGTPTNRGSIDVTWRSGRRSVITNVTANSSLVVDEASAQDAPASTTPKPEPWFEDVRSRIQHRDVPKPVGVLPDQPLLPHPIDRHGPDAAWFDFNGDGWEDLFIGSSGGNRPSVYRGNGSGGFIRQKAAAFDALPDSFITGILPWHPDASTSVLLISVGKSKAEDFHPGSLLEFSMNSGRIRELPLGRNAVPGPMAMADLDRDGDLDLFVGGRCAPGRYPESTPSTIFRNQGGRLEPDTSGMQAFSDTGLVNGAAFVDLEQDQYPDLVLAVEWGPIRILRNRKGVFERWNPSLVWMSSDADVGGLARAKDLDSVTGWWTTVASGDFDADGLPDLVAGNWGRNHFRAKDPTRPTRLYIGRLPGNTQSMLLEAVFDREASDYVPVRDRATIGTLLPGLLENFPSYASFGASAMPDLIRVSGLDDVRQVHASIFDSVVLLNRTNHFEVRLLPLEVQTAPVMGIAVADFNGDGNLDLALTQNVLEAPPNESRQDGGVGVLLVGDGHGGFEEISSSRSGFRVPGEGRGIAAADFDHDGRVDLLATQHRDETMLLRNRIAVPGVRVQLAGPSGNPSAIGAGVRLVAADGRLGPLHMIVSGGGSGSQPATDLVLGASERATAMEIRWPNGVRERVGIAVGSKQFQRVQPERSEDTRDR